MRKEGRHRKAGKRDEGDPKLGQVCTDATKVHGPLLRSMRCSPTWRPSHLASVSQCEVSAIKTVGLEGLGTSSSWPT